MMTNKLSKLGIALSVIFLTTIFLPAVEGYAAPTECIWIKAEFSGGTNNWNDPANWDDACHGASGVPQDGDSVLIPDTYDMGLSNNNISNLTLTKIKVLGDSPTINGNAITIEPTDGIAIEYGGFSRFDYRLDTTITSDTDVTIDTSTDWVEMTGDLILNITDSADLIIEGSEDNRIYGSISGSVDGELKLQSGDIRIFEANTFIGDVGIESSASVNISNPAALGPSSNTITLRGGELNLRDPSDPTYPYDIVVDFESLSSITDLYNSTLSGDILLNGDLMFRQDGDGKYTIVSGAITGTGDVQYTSSGIDNAFILQGSIANTYVGDTLIAGISVNAEKGDGIEAIPSDVSLDATIRLASLFLTNDEQVSDTSTVSIVEDSNGVFFNQSSTTETIGTLTGSGYFIQDSSAIMNIGGGNLSGEFFGVIESSNSQIIKVGSGTWTHSGTYMPNGLLQNANYEIKAGTFVANFADSSGVEVPILISGGTLKGISEVGPITSTSGAIAPGDSPGCIEPLLLTLASGVSVDIELEGTTACTQYDQINSTGAVVLGGSTLNIDIGFTPIVGDEFQIISGTSVSGSFAGLDDGERFNVGNTWFTVKYNPTNVTITVAEAPPVVTSLNTSGSLPSTGAWISGFVVLSVALVIAGFVLSSVKRKRVYC